MFPPSPAELARRHWWLAFFGGLVLLPVFSLALAISESHLTAANVLAAHAGEIALTAVSRWAAFVGIATLPAWLAGWLRRWPMAWLFAGVAQLRSRSGWLVLMVGTLLVFEATVLLGAAVLHWWIYTVDFVGFWYVCTAFSLPWLLASLWASWRVMPLLKSARLTQPLPQA